MAVGIRMSAQGLIRRGFVGAVGASGCTTGTMQPFKAAFMVILASGVFLPGSEAAERHLLQGALSARKGTEGS